MNGIPWMLVQKMMADAPYYDAGSEKEEKVLTVTEENADDILNYVNNLM